MKAFRDLKALPREVWILCFATLVNRAGTMALPFLVLYLTQELQFSREHAGAMLMLYGAVGLIVAPISGRLTDTLGPLRVMRLSLIGSGLALLLYPLATTRTHIVLVTSASAR